MWGVGDAAAALVGIPFGKHKVKISFLNGKKSWEGSCAMLLAATIIGSSLLSLYCGYDAGLSWKCALAMALPGTLVELVSPSEWDTVTVPVLMLIVALLLL